MIFLPGHSVSHEGLKDKEICHKDAENEDSLCMQSASQKQMNLHSYMLLIIHLKS